MTNGIEMSVFFWGAQEPIPTVESFLHILLEEWNGDDYRNEILDLLSHLSLQPFDGNIYHFQVLTNL